MTMTPEWYAKRLAEATVPVVPNRAGERARPTLPQLARLAEENYQKSKLDLERYLRGEKA